MITIDNHYNIGDKVSYAKIRYNGNKIECSGTIQQVKYLIKKTYSGISYLVNDDWVEEACIK